MVPLWCGKIGPVLVGAVYRRVDRDRPIHNAARVSHRQQFSQNLVPHSVTAVPAVTLPYRLPRTELRRYVTPSDSTSIPVNDALHHLAVIPKGRSCRPFEYGCMG